MAQSTSATTDAPYTLEQAQEDISNLNGQISLLEEMVYLLSNGITPNTQSDRASMYCGAPGMPAVITPAGLQMGFQGCQPATFPGITVTSPSLTTISNAHVIPGGDAAAIGAVYEIELWGNGVQGTTKQALSFNIAFGGSSSLAGVTFGTVAFNSANQAFRWRVQGRIICNTIGPTGTWTSYIKASTSDFGLNIGPGNSDFGEAFSCESSSTSTHDTTVSETLTILASWGSTTGGPTLTSRVQLNKRIA